MKMVDNSKRDVIWIRCPKCHHPMLDFEGECRTCGYTYTIVEDNTQDPQISKDEENLWMYKLSLNSCPYCHSIEKKIRLENHKCEVLCRSCGFSFKEDLFEWDDKELEEEITPKKNIDPYEYQFLKIDEKINLYNIKVADKPSVMSDDFNKIAPEINDIPAKSNEIENIGLLLYLIALPLEIVFGLSTKGEIIPLCISFIIACIFVVTGISLAQYGKRMMDRYNYYYPLYRQHIYEEEQYNWTHNRFNDYARLQILRYEDMLKFRKMVDRKCQKADKNIVVLDDQEMIWKINMSKDNLTFEYPIIMRSSAKSIELENLIRRFAKEQNISYKDARDIIMNIKVTGEVPKQIYIKR